VNSAGVVMTPEAKLAGQKVVVIGGTAGIGLETARRARSEGAEVILAARNAERLQQTAIEIGALSSAAFDATDFERLGRFFSDLPCAHRSRPGDRPGFQPTRRFRQPKNSRPKNSLSPTNPFGAGAALYSMAKAGNRFCGGGPFRSDN
jgi:short chain dehydrogenase